MAWAYIQEGMGRSSMINKENAVDGKTGRE